MWLRLSQRPIRDQISSSSTRLAIHPPAAPPRVCLRLCHLALAHLGEDREKPDGRESCCLLVNVHHLERAERSSCQGKRIATVAGAMPFGCARAQGQWKSFRRPQHPARAWLYTDSCAAHRWWAKGKGETLSLSPSCVCGAGVPGKFHSQKEVILHHYM